MTISRRTALAGGVTGLAAFTAGCLDFVLGDGPLEFEAERAAPSDGTVDASGYEERETMQETIEEELEAAGVEREVHATVWLSSYTKEVEFDEVPDDIDSEQVPEEYDSEEIPEEYDPEEIPEEYDPEEVPEDEFDSEQVPDEFEETSAEAAAFAAVSTPDVSIAGQTFNPIEEMDNEELIEEFASEMETDSIELEDVEQIETVSLSILGEDRDVDLLRGQSELHGETVDIDILMSSFANDDDYLVLAGLYPEMLTDQERAYAEDLLESVEHPA